MAKNHIRSLTLLKAVTRSFSTSNNATKSDDMRLYRRLSALGANPVGSVEKVMEDWVKEGRVVTEPKLVSIIKELRHYHNHKHALKVIDWMEKRGYNINTSIQAIRLDLISKYKGLEIAEHYFSNLPENSKNHITYGTLLNCYCQNKMVKKALSLHRKMKELNIPSNTLSIDNIMTLHLKLKEYEKVQSQFQEMKAANIFPGRITYGILMTSYAAQNDIDSVERVIGDIEKDGRVSLDWKLCCNVAGYYNSAGLHEKAEVYISKAEKLMPYREQEPYNFLITLYAAAGNLREVKRVWKISASSFRKVTNKSYFHMFHALKKLDDLDGLQECFQEWESARSTYDVKLVNVVIDAYLTKDRVEEANGLWKTAIYNNFGADFRTFELFVSYYLKKRDIDSAMKFFEKFAMVAKEEKWKPEKKKVLSYVKHLMAVEGGVEMEEFCGKIKALAFTKDK